jgi:hypothetical protein
MYNERTVSGLWARNNGNAMQGAWESAGVLWVDVCAAVGKTHRVGAAVIFFVGAALKALALVWRSRQPSWRKRTSSGGRRPCQ